ncbi:MAG: hypothetical protein U0531_18735 [Dehalococcoidia bacterium]
MSDDLAHDLAAYLDNTDAGQAGLQYLTTLGSDGAARLMRQVEADYRQATASIELSGRDYARIIALSDMLARAAGVSQRDGKETILRLLEAGWLMARWYGRD